MNARTRHKLRILVVAVAAAAGVGAIYGVLVNPDPLDGAVSGSIIGTLICGTLLSLQMFVFDGIGRRSLRRRPVWQHLLGSLVIATIVVVAALVVGQILGSRLTGNADPIRVSTSHVVFSLAVSAVFIAGAAVNQVLGGEVLLGLLSGRFATPQAEQRLFLFADLKGSTRLAEDLGDVRFHAFLNDVFCDLAEPIAAHRGGIHRYVGDGVIVTWPLRPDGSPPDALGCVRTMQAELTRRAPAYVRRYGAAPEMRYALHLGPVVSGEMGDLKREVVFLGDTVNTAARIEQAAKETACDVLASAAALERVPLPDDMLAEPLEGLGLKGKRAPVPLRSIVLRSEKETGRAA